MVAALASWLDARAHGGRWLVRIEDIDRPRTVAGAAERILEQLAACGLQPDAPPSYQSLNLLPYEQALRDLVQRDLAYPCRCSRKDIEAGWLRLGRHRARHADLIYPGTCAKTRTLGDAALTYGDSQPASAWRLRTAARFQASSSPASDVNHQHSSATTATRIQWQDRRCGPQAQDVNTQVGDFVLQRADGCFTYQLAVVVDDAAQGISHVVRGEDLIDNTARQILLQRSLGLPTPAYLHTPLVLGPNQEKLSKQNGAQAIDTSSPGAALQTLNQAALVLDLAASSGDIAGALQTWTDTWRDKFG